MPKSSSSLTLASIPLDRSSARPLHRQLYDRLREGILSGQLRPGFRLPPTRTLADELGVSRNTVLTAFDELLAEGCIEGKVGSGTYVSPGLPADILSKRKAVPQPRPGPRPRISRRGRFVTDHLKESWPPGSTSWPYVFRAGLPAFDAFPYRQWKRLVARHWHRPPQEILYQREVPDYPPLRRAVADYLRAARGVRCDPEQVLFLTGAQQAIDLVARVLLDPGDPVWVEDPGYVGGRNTLKAVGLKLVPVNVDEEGLCVDAGIKRCPNGRLACVTPSFQFPLGVTMSLARRLKLLDWAERARSWVLEDDYYSELRYVGPPLPALQGLDIHGRVIYLGTFTKVLLPLINLAYLVVPAGLLDTFQSAHRLSGRRACIEQAALADFIGEGHFARHIRRMRSLYVERQAAFVEAAERELAGLLEVRRSDCGMHLMGWLPPGVDDIMAESAARRQGVETSALSRQYVRRCRRGGLILGYTAFTPSQIREGVERLAKGLSELAPHLHFGSR